MAVFAFKDFIVRQEYCPLKVSTDAILLGASVQLPNRNLKILDVGTGNGVIALLLASRFDQVHITGIDPNEGAVQDAQFNFAHSNYASRLNAIQTTLAALPLDQKYDVVVSNPPFFIDSMPAHHALDQQAKHMAEPAYFDLLLDMCLRCHEEGQIWLILPPALAVQTLAFCQTKGWNRAQEIHFHANAQKLDKRWVVCLKRNAQKDEIQNYFIRDLDGSFHADYRKLAGPFHDRPI